MGRLALPAGLALRASGLGKREDERRREGSRLARLVQGRGSMPWIDEGIDDDLDDPIEDDVGQVRAEGWALSGFTLDVEQGAALAIVGDENSGSATLMQILARIVRPSEGSVVLRTPVAVALESSRGLVQPVRSTRDNVILVGRLLGASKRQMEECADHALDFAGLASQAHVRAVDLDKDAQRRLVIAIAFELSPAVLVADAAMFGRERWFVDRLDEQLERRRAEGLALLVAGSREEVLRRVCDRAVLMMNGVVVREGTPEAVLAEAVEQGESGPLPRPS